MAKSNNTVTISAEAILKIKKASVDRINRDISKAIKAATSHDLDKSEKDLKQFSKSYARTAKSLSAVSTGLEDKAPGTTLGQFFGSKTIPKEIKSFQLLKKESVNALQGFYRDLDKVSNTAVLGNRALISKGGNLFERLSGLSDKQGLKLLGKTKGGQTALNEYQSYLTNRQQQFQSVHSRTLNKLDEEGKKDFGTVIPKFTTLLEQQKKDIKALKALGTEESREADKQKRRKDVEEKLAARRAKREAKAVKEAKELRATKAKERRVDKGLRKRLAAEEQAVRNKEQGSTTQRRADAQKGLREADLKAKAIKRANAPVIEAQRAQDKALKRLDRERLAVRKENRARRKAGAALDKKLALSEQAVRDKEQAATKNRRADALKDLTQEQRRVKAEKAKNAPLLAAQKEAEKLEAAKQARLKKRIAERGPLSERLTKMENTRRELEQKATKDRRVTQQKEVKQQKIKDGVIKTSQKQVKEEEALEKKREKIAKAERKRNAKLRETLGRRNLVQQGRQILGGNPNAISGIQQGQLRPANEYLRASRSTLVKAIDRQATRASRGDVGAAGRLTQLETQLTGVNQALAVGQTRMKGFKSFTSQAASTLRLFFRYAVGYGVLYQMLGAVTGLVKGLVDLDKALVGIRAISAATTSEMTKIEAAIKRVAVTTKFNLAEIAGAAQTLAQAGVRPDEMSSALESVALFASATNTTLATSADLISTMRNVFTDLTDGQIADQLTKAVNISKLTGEDLKTILSRGTQVAKAYNITSKQFLAAAAVLRNAGIKASTVSTGLRQAILELLSPDAKTLKVLSARYRELGENLSKDAIKSKFFSFSQSDNPLLAVLTELKRLGAGGSGAKLFTRLFDVRAENVIKVLSSNLDQLDTNLAKLGGTGGAAFAASTQMTSLSASMQNLGAVIISLSDSISGNLVGSLAEGTTSFTEFLKTIDDGIIKLKADTGAGVGGGILASLGVGITTGFKSTGGAGAKVVKGLAAGIATGGAISAGQSAAEGTGVNVSDIAGKLALTAGNIAILVTLIGVVKSLFGSGAAKFAAAKKSLAVVKRFGAARFVTSLLGGIPGIILGIATAILTFSDIFGGSDAEKDAVKLDNLSKQLEKVKADKKKIDAFAKDLDITEAGSTGEQVKELTSSVKEFRKKLEEVLGNSITDTQESLIRELGSSALDLGSTRAKAILEKLNEDPNLSLNPESGAIRELQELAAANRSYETQTKGRVQDIKRTIAQLTPKDLEKEENKRLLNSFRKASEGADAVSDVMGSYVTFLEIFLSAQGLGLEEKNRKLAAEVTAARAAVNQAQIKQAVRSGDPEKIKDAARNIATTTPGTSDADFENLRNQKRFLEQEIEIEDARRKSSQINLPGFRKIESLDRSSRTSPEIIQKQISSNLLTVSRESAEIVNRLAKSKLAIQDLLSGPNGKAVALAIEKQGVDVEANSLQTIKSTGANGQTGLSSTGAKLAKLADSLTQEFGTKVEEFRAKDTNATKRRIASINEQIAAATRENKDAGVTQGLIKQRQALERSLLAVKRQDIERNDKLSLKDQAEKTNAVDTELHKLKIKQKEELRKSIESARTKDLDDASKQMALELAKVNQKLSETASAEADYLPLLEERRALGEALKRLEFAKLDILGKANTTSEEQLAFDLEKLEKDKKAAALVKAREVAEEAVRVAERGTLEERTKSAKGIPLTTDGRVANLGTQITAQEGLLSNKNTELTKAEKIDKNSVDAKRLKLEIESIEDALLSLRTERNKLTKGLVAQVADGFNLDTIRSKLDAMSDSVQNLGDKISDSLAGALDSIGDKFVDAIHKGEDFFESMKALVTQTLLDITRAIIKAQINQLLSGVLGSAGVSIPGITAPAPAKTTAGTAAGAVGAAAGLVEGEGEGGACCAGLEDLPETIGGLGDTFSRGFESFKGFFSGLGDSISGLFKGGGGAVSGIINSGVNIAKSAGNAALGYFGFPPVFRDGKAGVVKGAGTGTSDSIPAFISNGESILTAKVTKSLGSDFINDLNSGKIKGFAQGGADLSYSKVSSPVDSLRQSLDNRPQSSGNSNGNRIINVLDPSLVSDYLASSEGEETVLNIMRRNPNGF